MKRFLVLTIAAMLSIGTAATAFADEVIPSDTSIISIEAEVAEDAFYEIKDQIIDDYSHLYKLDDFSYDYTVRDEDDKKYLDINVYVDMALTRHPSESPYVLGMEKALSEVTDADDKKVCRMK